MYQWHNELTSSKLLEYGINGVFAKPSGAFANALFYCGFLGTNGYPALILGGTIFAGTLFASRRIRANLRRNSLLVSFAKNMDSIEECDAAPAVKQLMREGLSFQHYEQISRNEKISLRRDWKRFRQKAREEKEELLRTAPAPIPMSGRHPLLR